MSPHDLTPSELASLIAPANHPERLSADELDRLISHLSESQLDAVVRQLGVNVFIRQLPLVFSRVFLAARRVAEHRSQSPDDDELFEDLIRDFDEESFETSTPPPSSPEPPVTPLRSRQVQSTPSTPQTAPIETPRYTYSTPTAAGSTITWFQAGALTQGVRGASVHAVPGSQPRSTAKGSAYTIFFGGEVGVFESWDDVMPRIKGHGLAIYGGFISVDAAAAALQYAREKGWTGDSNPPPYNAGPPVPSQLEDNPLNAGAIHKLWYTVCRGIAPGVYRSWLECSLNVSGVKGSLHTALATRDQAERAFNSALASGLVKTLVR
ncbi:hypothetical protein C8F04DRAFT_1280888 [Mycena alexandri]|uniref:Ribonuclease H1 N-terminal domain-containing protein n=1 Tax=Mycena alexandri TaxID=1745969 RepID=A0AAD6RWJ5_9AGAR|nr:hypothetical protein C8F04DRAFT_1280888 [Mycena alexandri]